MDDIWKARRKQNPVIQTAEFEHDGPLIEFELVDERHRRGRDESGMEIGPDLVLFFGDKVVVCSPKEMFDWEARDFQRPKIMFQGLAYYLSHKLPGDQERPFRYELAAWPEFLREEPKHTIVYDEDYVQMRDGRFKKVKSVSGKPSRLLFLYPFLGYAWSGMKKNFLEPHGFNPLRISLFSCVLSYSIFLAELISFFWFSSGVLQWAIGNSYLWLDYTFLLILPVDAAVRFFQIVNGTARYPDGFLEWIVSFFRSRREARIMDDEDSGF